MCHHGRPFEKFRVFFSKVNTMEDQTKILKMKSGLQSRVSKFIKQKDGKILILRGLRLPLYDSNSEVTSVKMT